MALEGSNGTGCLVIFTSGSDYEQVVNVYKVDDSTVSSITTTVPDDIYNVTVYRYDVVGSDIGLLLEDVAISLSTYQQMNISVKSYHVC